MSIFTKDIVTTKLRSPESVLIATANKNSRFQEGPQEKKSQQLLTSATMFLIVVQALRYTWIRHSSGRGGGGNRTGGALTRYSQYVAGGVPSWQVT